GIHVAHFAEACSRNAFFLLSRRPEPRFRFADLIGKTVLGFLEAPTPWQCLLTVLRRHAVEPARVRIERERPMLEAAAAFRAGEGDYLETTQPIVETLLGEGASPIGVPLAAGRGRL